MALAARLVGRVDLAGLQSALDELLRRQEILRSAFLLEGENIMQAVNAPGHVVIRLIDARATTTDNVASHTQALMLEEGAIPFDLAKGPLLRATLASFSERDHLLMLTMPHIACDGWSNGIVIQELAENYTRMLRGGSVPAELPLQYSDYAVWQSEWLNSTEGIAQRDYWRQLFPGEVPVLNLPTDRPRSKRATNHGTIETKLLPAILSDEMRQFCQAEKVTVYMGYLAVYLLLLARYSGKSEFVVGSAAACRNQTELEATIGLFANPILFRPRIETAGTFRSLLHMVRDLTLASFARQEYPFEIIAEDLRPESSRRGVPWLQAYFLYQKAFMLPQEMPDLTLTPLRSISPGAMFETFLSLVERKEGVRLQLEYNTDLFEQSTIARALRHLHTIISTAVKNPDFIIGDLDLDEPDRAPVSSAAMPAETPAGGSLLDRIVEAFGSRDAAIVFEHAGKPLTLAALRAYSARVKNLLDRGTSAKLLRIGIAFDEPVIAVSTLIAIGSTEHSAIPSHAHDAGTDALLAGTQNDPALQPSAAPPPAVSPTGGPAVFLRNILSATPEVFAAVSILKLSAQGTAVSTALKLPAQARVFSTAPLDSLQAWEDFIAAWTLGSTVIWSGDRELAAARIAPPDASVFLLTSALVSEIVRSQSGPWMAALLRARLITVDRDPLSPHALRKLAEPQGGTMRLVQRWQPRESGLTVAVQTLRPQPLTPAPEASAPPLQTVSGWALETVDHHGVRTPFGIPGQIRVSGTRNEPAATAILTADYARWRDGGSLEWLGHAEDLDRGRHLTVELKQLRDVACEHPAVWDAQAVTIVGKDGDAGAVVLHLILRQGASAREADLHRFLDERLPDYVLPTAIAFHAAGEWANRFDYPTWREPRWLGLSVAGSGQRQWSAETTTDGPNADSASPRNDAEMRLATIFGELLHLPTVDVRRGFFELGGHSLLGVKLFVRIEKEFKQRLPLATLLSASSVRGLAGCLRQPVGAAPRWSCLVPIHPQGNGPRFFCVHGAGGNVLLYRNLARHLTPAVRFYGLQAQGLDGHSRCLTDIRDMAAVYLHEIQAEQPQGPYYIGGYCMGGNIAFEMARLLREQGQEIRLLALLDTYNLRLSTFTGSPLARLRILFQKFGFHLDTLAHLSLREKRSYLAEKLRMARELSSDWWRSVLQNRQQRVSGGPTSSEIVSFVQSANHIALRAHDPQPLVCDLTLFHPRKNYYTFRDPRMGWGKLVQGRLESVVVANNPHSMLIDPCAQTLATELMRRIVGTPAPFGGGR